jgi:hypothetical protein
MDDINDFRPSKNRDDLQPAAACASAGSFVFVIFDAPSLKGVCDNGLCLLGRHAVASNVLDVPGVPPEMRHSEILTQQILDVNEAVRTTAPTACLIILFVAA